VLPFCRDASLPSKRSSCTTTCRARSSPTTRKRAGPGAAERRAECLLLYKVEEDHQYCRGDKDLGAENIIGPRDTLVSLDSSDRQVSLRDMQAAAASVAETRIRSVLAVMTEIGLLREHRGSRIELVRSDASEAGGSRTSRDNIWSGVRPTRPDWSATWYAQSATCRWKLLLEYFGEAEAFERCGFCDNRVDPLELRHEPPSSSRVAPVLV
jgi:ATP-dependent DNA helicase RecQ